MGGLLRFATETLWITIGLFLQLAEDTRRSVTFPLGFSFFC